MKFRWPFMLKKTVERQALIDAHTIELQTAHIKNEDIKLNAFIKRNARLQQQRDEALAAVRWQELPCHFIDKETDRINLCSIRSDEDYHPGYKVEFFNLVADTEFVCFNLRMALADLENPKAREHQLNLLQIAVEGSFNKFVAELESSKNK